ncbi:tail tubular protein B [uncultured phage_MedDCM-OCT-S28-C3]|uniref:Tail tubular protein B n=1 Tax=uncultured phage_MedDCM-OCT-S28-C3 TaxID=2740802 RepID=A0A6S4PFW4_9CAUD|nr:tail protein [uncultured phage_MedDCM-OCT-S28-C3]BAQ94033.1 tail tubular protein B [uncultured phage_MedDCM-OCT-S28-C3]
MPAVTQRIGNYLGGVSQQSDNKKLPGQVRECYNGFPDATYGLTKRPGFEHIVNLGTGTTYDDGKWFYIRRDDAEEYIGVIKGTDIDIWNAVSGVAATVSFTDGTGYLSGTKDDYKIITIQDTSIIVNGSKTVAADTAVSDSNYDPDRSASIILKTVVASETYTVDITIGGSTQTATFTTSSSSSADTILNDLKSDIEAMTGSHAGITVTKLANELELQHTADMDVHAEGGIDNLALVAIKEVAVSTSDLPVQSRHGRLFQIKLTAGNDSDFWVKFVANDGVSGEGYYEETIDPTVSVGLDNSTMPHELVNTALNTFIFRQIDYTDRLVGDLTTNSNPSFVGSKIASAFFHNNRLGFISDDNVILSRSGDFYNFFFSTAQTIVDSDPVDISCSSVRPTSLHSVLPTAQGVVLFSENQQFIMFSDTGVLTPSLTTIRTLSNYQTDKNIEPVEVGTNISFVSKTPGYSRIFSMVTRGQQENPQVLDISRVVKEWISPDIDSMIASPQNSMIAASGQSLNEVFIYRYYNDGEKNLMEAWVSWLMPGNVQFLATNSDEMYAVTKQASQFTLVKAALSQSPEQAIIVNNKGEKVNPCVDLYKNIASSAVVYDSTNRRTKCYIPYNDVSGLTPIIVIKGNTSTGDFVESGFTITPERGSDTNGPNSPATETFFIIPSKNLTASGEGALNVAGDVIVGYKYNFDVELPRTYFRPESNQTDFTANLTISRMKFAVGLSGNMSFKLKQVGRLPYSRTFTGDGSTTTFTFSEHDLEFENRSDVKVTVNGAPETAFSFTNDTTIVFTTAPANNAEIIFFVEEWFDVQPVIEANTYLANDVPLDNDTVFTLPIHQRTENFSLKLFNNSPFPIAVNSMMWEGRYTPRYYKRIS